jgi:hypothetical protein
MTTRKFVFGKAKVKGFRQMKKVLLEDFIGIFDEALSPVECAKLIDLFEDCSEFGLTVSRNSYKDERDDESMCFYGNSMGPYQKISEQGKSIAFKESGFSKMILSKVYEATRKYYTKKWSLFPVSSNLNGFSYKIQKTTKGQGYHVWHHEACFAHLSRTLVWTIYLSDVDKDLGGETQFLYYPHKCIPKEGRLLIFPAHFTHTHRGNIYWGDNPKYIATGWLNWDSPTYAEEGETSHGTS